MRTAWISALLLGSIFSISACPSAEGTPPLERRTARIDGIVVDESGIPLPFVTVSAHGIATLTDARGRFVLDGVPAGSSFVELAAKDRPTRVAATTAPASHVAWELPSSAITEIVFSGDVMFARRYLDPSGDGSGKGALADARDPASFEALVRHVSPLTRSSDLTLPNVETPFGWGGTAHPSKPFVFISPPASVAALHALGADLALLANNHTYDFFDPGLQSTLDVLHGASIQTVGAGMNETEAYQPTVVTHGTFRLGVAPFCGLRICGVSAGDGTLPDEPPYQNAVGDKGGVARLSDDKLASALDTLRPCSDRVVVVLHSGNEYQPTPSEGQKKAAHRAIDLGADFVVGHHPHVLQPLEAYRGKLIAYSLGNLVFDQDFRETWSSALLRVRSGVTLEHRVEPIYLDDYLPHAATGRIARSIVRDLAERSAPSGVTIFDDGSVSLTPASFEDTHVARDAIADRDGRGATLSLSGLVVENRSLARVDSAAVATGRDVLVVGSFEHDLADADWDRVIGWNTVSSSQRLVGEGAYDGSRALRMCRDVTSATSTGLYSAGRHRIVPGRTYSLCGCARGSEMSHARASIAYFSDVAADSPPIATVPVLDDTPSAEWSCFCAESTPPAGAEFVNVRLEVTDASRSRGCSGPDDEAHCVDWDALRLVEWTPLDGDRLPVPNAIEFVRTAAAGTTNVTIATVTTQPPVEKEEP